MQRKQMKWNGSTLAGNVCGFGGTIEACKGGRTKLFGKESDLTPGNFVASVAAGGGYPDCDCCATELCDWAVAACRPGEDTELCFGDDTVFGTDATGLAEDVIGTVVVFVLPGMVVGGTIDGGGGTGCCTPGEDDTRLTLVEDVSFVSGNEGGGETTLGTVVET